MNFFTPENIEKTQGISRRRDVKNVREEFESSSKPRAAMFAYAPVDVGADIAVA
jgi:hypothetical protein